MSRKVTWKDVDVQCPFYLEGAGNTIVCEGQEENSTLSLRFHLQKEKDHYMGIHCVGPYQQCCIYKMVINNKYPD